MPLPAVSSWFQVNGDSVCAVGLTHIPAFVLVIGFSIPIIFWLAEKAAAALWGDFVKHIARRVNYLDTLAKTRAKLSTAIAAEDALKEQLAIEQKAVTKLFVENDWVVGQYLKLTVENAQLKDEVARLRRDQATQLIER